MATLPDGEPADNATDHHPHEMLGAHRGKWVAFGPPSRFLGFGETAAEAFAAGQAAGEAQPTIRRVPEKGTPAP